MFRVYRRLSEIGPDQRQCALCIGNFDGVHAGHRQILRRAVELGREHDWIPSVLTFEPHPTKVVAPERAPLLLNTTEQKIELMHDAGIEQVFVLLFDRSFSRMTPVEFTERILVDGVKAAAVLVGENFHFGAKQAGNVGTLKELGTEFGFRTEVVPSVSVRGYAVSSSAIRKLLTEGSVELAARMLERPYRIEGNIVTGHGIGSKQTVPTLNMDAEAEILPANGVYITQTCDSDTPRNWPSITNVGFRPTFGGDKLTIETHLLAPLNGETPARIRLEFLKHVRPEMKFDSPEVLKQQILKDVAKAEAFFRRLPKRAKSGGYTET